MRELVLHLPDNLDFDDQKMTVFLAAKLYEDGKLSLGAAAQIAGMPYREFMEVLTMHDVSIFNYPPEDFDRDLASIESRHR
ncbi:MAG TPA: UPF0175 family protein [Candidatus Kapabacteria bacterium]|jgi:predicted HTH domain antitoxin|nr:UPF0175 family protein [Candidatus Kapabacteria bacterium]